MNMNTLIGKDLHLLDAHEDMPCEVIGTVDDVLLDLETRHLLYLRVQTGNSFEDAPLLLGMNRLTFRGNTLCTTLDQTAMDIARTEAASPKPGPLDPARLPAILTGPFGNTVSPRMMATVVNARLNEREEACHQMPDPAGPGWRFFTDLQEIPVLGTRGPIGPLQDLEVDWATGQLTQLRIARTPGIVLSVEANLLAHLPKGDDYLVTRAGIDADAA